MALALCYGGADGYEERDALLDDFRDADSRTYSVLSCDRRKRPDGPPIAVFIWREK